MGASKAHIHASWGGLERCDEHFGHGALVKFLGHTAFWDGGLDCLTDDTLFVNTQFVPIYPDDTLIYLGSFKTLLDPYVFYAASPRQLTNMEAKKRGAIRLFYSMFKDNIVFHRFLLNRTGKIIRVVDRTVNKDCFQEIN